MDTTRRKCDIVIVGAGPAGLAAAEVASRSGYDVQLFERMPTPARKFLMAGKSGLNITHSEPSDVFLTRYGNRQSYLSAALSHFGAEKIVRWVESFNQKTFTGTSGRIFPKAMKASPLLRAWLARLDTNNVTLNTRHTWSGWSEQGALMFDTPEGPVEVEAQATILALGGASWSRLGSMGDWTAALAAKNIKLEPFKPANCGFNVEWSDHFKDHFAGAPVKNVTIDINGAIKKGEFVTSQTGVEGSLIYTDSVLLRDALESETPVFLSVDLAPDRSLQNLTDTLMRPRGKRSLSNHIRKRTGLQGVKLGLLYELVSRDDMNAPEKLAGHIKSLRIPIISTRPIDEAISVAGGVSFNSLTNSLMLYEMPGVFCAGEMTDWEAPTGGYLLTACMAQGRHAAVGALHWMESQQGNSDD